MNRIIVLTIWAGLTLATVLIMFGDMAESASDEEPTLAEKEEEFRAWIGRVAARTPKEGGVIGNRVNLKKSKKGKDKSKGKGKVVDGVIRVNKKGKGNYKTVQAAVNAVPINNNQRVVIQIDAGIYKEKVDVSNRPFITFEGAGAKSTVITWHDTAGSAGGTFSSASVAINSDNFIAKGISFENSAPPPPEGAVDRQAVALRISGDKAAFYNCKFLGAQDTLYDHQGRHYFENCYIQGSIDFICGDGQSLYSGCTLHAISSGSFTAQKRDSQNEETGFSFVNCNVTGSGMLYLGRAWGRFSRVVFSYTYMDPIIKPAGWFNWGDPDRNSTVFYGQYKCSGPGAVEDGRVVWSMELSDEEAAPFQTLSYINGEEWIQS